MRRIEDFHMRRGNLIALFFQIPFLIILSVLMKIPFDQLGKARGFWLVGLAFGGIAWFASFLYILISNIKKLSSYADASPILSPILRFITLYQKRIRFVLCIFVFLVLVLKIFAPKQKVFLAPTMLGQSTILSLHR